ncbi:MAG: alkaline phosphatase [Ignavibacteria bacterium]|nr:alkaline phosphatase [Ignavibacteria bacterium]
MKRLLIAAILFINSLGHLNAQISEDIKKGNVIFIHPDGTSVSVWNAVRMLYVGPDSDINWDKLPNIGIYRGHLTNSLTATSNGGGTVHAYGVKVGVKAYGMDEDHTIPTSRSGKKMSIMHEAMKSGIKTGLINSGSIVEPGTGAFVALVNSRAEDEEVAKQIALSGVDVILCGGEEWLIPQGMSGYHCNDGKRKDGRNLIEEVKALGYTVVYDRSQLLSLPETTEKLLGIFAETHTFNDKTEEDQKLLLLPNYKLNTPTLAEMTEVVIKILSKNDQQFFLVVEEEGTDNFGNKNNANGILQALKHADDALGVSLNFLNKKSNTLILTCSDSEAGGMEAISFTEDYFPFDKPLPKTAKNGAPYDGLSGTETPPFKSAPDKLGRVFPFVISWSSFDDICGSVVVRAAGLNSELVKGSIDNTDIYKFMYITLFGINLK